MILLCSDSERDGKDDKDVSWQQSKSQLQSPTQGYFKTRCIHLGPPQGVVLCSVYTNKYTFGQLKFRLAI